MDFFYIFELKRKSEIKMFRRIRVYPLIDQSIGISRVTLKLCFFLHKINLYYIYIQFIFLCPIFLSDNDTV